MRVGYHGGTLGRMDILGFEVEPRTEGGTSAHDRWYAERFGMVPALGVLVADLDAAVAELRAQGTEVGEVQERSEDEGGGRWAVAVGPAGQPVDVIQAATAADHEGRITAFIDTAAPLDGPPTEELAAAVAEVVAGAWDRIEALLDGVAHNKVLATHLLVGQQARALDPMDPDSPAYWQRSAAGTLLSGFVGRGARAGRTES
jgi:hypothetical protein